MEPVTLAEVAKMFAAWRSTKQHREPIPKELWDAAASLTNTYSIYQISKSLSLCYTTLKKRTETRTKRQSTSLPTSPDFIDVDFSPAAPAECCIEMEHHNGNRMRMHFKGKVELDLQIIAESFWSKT